MPEENNNGAGAGGEGEKPQPVSMTQDELDKLISERIERARKSWTAEKDKADEEARKQAEIEKLEGAQKLEAQYKLQFEKLSAERDESLRQLRIANARADLSSRGLDPTFAETLIGKDEASTKANIDSFQKMVDAQVGEKVKAGLAKGAPPASAGASGGEEDPIKTAINKGFGIKSQ